MQGAERTESEPLDNNEKYIKVRDINRGSYGFVQLARDRADCTEVAVSRAPPLARFLWCRWVKFAVYIPNFCLLVADKIFAARRGHQRVC